MKPKIKFVYKGKRYVLQYNRETVIEMERKGFNACELLDKPLTVASTMLPELFSGAFLACHPNASEKLIAEIYSKFDDKLGLLNALVSMYADAVGRILDQVEEVHTNPICWEKC